MTLVMNLLGIVFVLFGFIGVCGGIGFTVISILYADNAEMTMDLINAWSQIFDITKEKV